MIDVTGSGAQVGDVVTLFGQISEVVAVGPGGIVNGEKVEMTVSVGDKVITTKYSGAEVKIDGVEYVIVSVGDILAVVEQ